MSCRVAGIARTISSAEGDEVAEGLVLAVLERVGGRQGGLLGEPRAVGLWLTRTCISVVEDPAEVRVSAAALQNHEGRDVVFVKNKKGTSILAPQRLAGAIVIMSRCWPDSERATRWLLPVPSCQVSTRQVGLR